MTKKVKPSIVIATKREAMWMEVKEISQEKMIRAEKDVEVHREVIKLANKIIREEKNAS